jgi:hypothetical protein
MIWPSTLRQASIYAGVCAVVLLLPGGAAATAARQVKLSIPPTSLHGPSYQGYVQFAEPRSWVRQSGGRASVEFQLAVSPGCHAVAAVDPESRISAQPALTQLRQDLPIDAMQGDPIPPQGNLVAHGRRAHSGAWELIALPPPGDGSISYDYYGGLFVEVGHDRWAGLEIGVAADPGTCATRVLTSHAVAATVDQILRRALLQAR